MGTREIPVCYCGKPGLIEHRRVIGGKKIWADLRFCSYEHKEQHERIGDYAAAVHSEAGNNRLGRSLETEEHKTKPREGRRERLGSIF